MDWNSPGAIVMALILIVAPILGVAWAEVEFFIKRRRERRAARRAGR